MVAAVILALVERMVVKGQRRRRRRRARGET